MSIRIRRVEMHELDELTDIARSTFINAFGEQNDPANMEAYLSSSLNKEKIEEELNHQNSDFYFAESKENIIGYLKLNTGSAQNELLPDALEIERIYIKSEWQGKKIGQLLMNEAMTIARTKELSTVWLGVWDQNVDAIRFYERNGFQIFNSHKFYLGQDEQTDLLMKIEI